MQQTGGYVHNRVRGRQGPLLFVEQVGAERRVRCVEKSRLEVRAYATSM